jgi:hypothetical protein
MAAAARLRREYDLDQSTRSWYRVEEAARAYLDKFPGRALDPDEPPIPFIEARRAMGSPSGLSPSARLAMPPGPPQEGIPSVPQEGQAAGSDLGASDPDDKDALIRSLAAALADKEAENRRLRAALADPARRRGVPLRRHGPKD